MNKILKNPIIKNTVILTMITLISGLLLGLVYEVTKNPIAFAKEKAKQEAYKEVFADAESFEALENFEEYIVEANVINEVVVAHAGAEKMGYVITVTNNEAYGGSLTITMGIRNDGTTNGISFLTLAETAGLGMKAKESEFKNQYADKNVDSFEVTKTGAANDNQIDAISGATITSKSVTSAVNAGITYFEEVLGGTANE